jgi:cell division protease FtsH
VNFLNKILRNSTIWLLIIIVIGFLVFHKPPAKPIDLTYTEFINEVEQQKVVEVKILAEDNRYTVAGTLIDEKEFKAIVPADLAIYDFLREHEVKIVADAAKDPWWLNLIYTFLTMAVVIGLFALLMWQNQAGAGKAMQFSKSRARLHVDDR